MPLETTIDILIGNVKSKYELKLKRIETIDSQKQDIKFLKREVDEVEQQLRIYGMQDSKTEITSNVVKQEFFHKMSIFISSSTQSQL